MDLPPQGTKPSLGGPKRSTSDLTAHQNKTQHPLPGSSVIQTLDNIPSTKSSTTQTVRCTENQENVTKSQENKYSMQTDLEVAQILDLEKGIKVAIINMQRT